MAGISYNTLITQIRNYTEVDANVLTTDQLENIILNAQYRIMRDVPIDADRKQQTGNLVTGQETINAPGGALFIRGIQVYDSLLIYKNILHQQNHQKELNQNTMLCLVMLRETVILILDVYFYLLHQTTPINLEFIITKCRLL
jgi:hypothetical protein